LDSTAESLLDVAYSELKKLIISAEYLPGSLISENELSKRLDISRTPIHAAMIKLEQEGFVELISKRGAMVRDVSFSEFFEMHETIVALERYAFSRAKSRGSVFDLVRLKSCLDVQATALEKNDYLSYYSSGFDFALIIIETLNNKKMLDVIDLFRDRMVFKIVTYRKTHPNTKPHVALRTHNAMYQALAEDNISEAASELMRNLGAISKHLMKNRLI